MFRNQVSQSNLSRWPKRPAFTLIELLIIIVILSIAFGMVLPMIGDSKELRLREAARMLAADLELAQTESITHGDDTRLVKFDTKNQRYWIAPASAPDTPITDLVRKEPFLVSFGTGRASGTEGVTIQSLSLGGDDELHFSAQGIPDQTTDALVTLKCGKATMLVRVDAENGEVSISSPKIVKKIEVTPIEKEVTPAPSPPKPSPVSPF